MPKIRRRNLPPLLLDHLLHRIKSRQISSDQLGLLADWLDTQPEVPNGKWFKRFSGMIVCGEGEWSEPGGRDIDGQIEEVPSERGRASQLVRTFLTTTQAPIGTEVI